MRAAPTAKHREIRGFSLIELLVALFLAILLPLVALPAYRDWIAALDVTNEAQHLANGMNFARAEAIKRGRRVNLCKSVDGKQCTTASAWHGGWIMHDDGDADGQIKAGESSIRALEPVAPGVTITANHPLADYVSYTAYGHARMLSGALQIGTFTVCGKGQKALDVVLSAGGRARIARTGVACP
jgi:type IV fimbrial biogenesis protein FimT